MSIASGDFGQRMSDITPGTEVGRLKSAINAMLDRVDSAIAQRDTTVEHMRRFIGDASHELRTPLVTVRGYAELHRMGAISGKILDADGSVLFDLFDEFGVSSKKVTTALATADTDVRAKLMEAKRHAEKQLPGMVITGWRAYCAEDYLDGLVKHKNVEKAYAN